MDWKNQLTRTPYLVLFIVLISIGVDSVYAGIEMGDGMILERELSIVAGAGFVSGETITITQVDVTDFALGIFTDLNAGQINSDELDIIDGSSGIASQSVIITDGVNTAEGFFNDLNLNTAIDNGEITITSSDSFPNGIVDIKGGVATANFQDVVMIEDGELAITNSGSDYADGTVVLSGNTSPSATIATFVDLPVCPIPISAIWMATFDCTVSSNATVPANAIILNDSLVIVLKGVTLDIDFINHNLTVKFGSGVLIKAGGKIT